MAGGRATAKTQGAVDATLTRIFLAGLCCGQSSPDERRVESV